MKKTRYTEEQMLKIMSEADVAPVTEVARKRGASEAMIVTENWRRLSVRVSLSLSA